MKKLMVFGLLFGLLCAPLMVQAAEEMVAAAAAVEVGNKICPVSGEKVGQMGEIVKQEYNGKVYNLCCGMCVKDFQKDPAKYAKIAEDAAKVEAGAVAN